MTSTPKSNRCSLVRRPWISPFQRRWSLSRVVIKGCPSATKPPEPMPYGNPDAVEFINVSQDDAPAWPKIVHRTYPRTVNARMDNTIIPFVKKSRAINVSLLGILERKLEIPEGGVRADLGGHLKYSRRWSGVRAGVLLGAQGAVRRGENRGGL